MFRRLWFRFWFLAGGVNLRVKIMGIVLLIVLTMGFSFAWFTWRNVASSLEREIEMRGIAIGNSLATNAANFILTDDMFEVYRLVRNALKTDDIRYIYIEDAEGLVLAHTFSAGFPTDLLDVNQLKGDATVVVPLDTGEEQLIDVSVPILRGAPLSATTFASSWSLSRLYWCPACLRLTCWPPLSPGLWGLWSRLPTLWGRETIPSGRPYGPRVR